MVPSHRDAVDNPTHLYAFPSLMVADSFNDPGYDCKSSLSSLPFLGQQLREISTKEICSYLGICGLHLQQFVWTRCTLERPLKSLQDKIDKWHNEKKDKLKVRAWGDSSCQWKK